MLPLGLSTAAQPRWRLTAGCRAGAQPPAAASPRLHGRAAPSSRVDRAMSNAWSSPARPEPGRGQARWHGPARPGRTGPDRSPARHRSPWFLASRPVLRSGVWQRLLGRACTPSSPPLGKASIERLVPKAGGRVAEGDSAGIEPNTAALGDWNDPPTTRPILHPGALLSSGKYGSSVERTATLHPLWR